MKLKTEEEKYEKNFKKFDQIKFGNYQIEFNPSYLINRDGN